jgi:2-polyprenyl-6-methoxyphenol hydroxylase-like FAD-dependent oxidoreductase
MAVGGGRVGVVGGSIAGCAAAIALRRANCEVTIYERSAGELQDRGVGIAIPVTLRAGLAAAGYLAATMPVHQIAERLWVVRDPEPRNERERAFGRVAFRQPFPGVINNWGILWRTLRAALPDEIFIAETSVTAADAGVDGARLETADGRSARYDVIVGADGYRSMIRGLVDPRSRPAYAGYALWRGSYAASRAGDLVPPDLDGAAVTVCFPGGHGVVYLIPGRDRHDRLINWAVYATVPPLQVPFDGPTWVPPGTVDDELAALLDQVLDAHFPPSWAEIVRRTTRAELAIQPVYDTTVSTYVRDRLMLAGDAGALARPHTAAGAAKALEDALALDRACQDHDTWDEVLTAYDDARRAAGNAFVDLGRRLGAAQVERTPPWTSMTPEQFQAWTEATLAGRPWLYGS